MAVALSTQQKFKESVNAGEIALSLSPTDDTNIHGLLCYTCGMNNQPAESAREARIVLKSDPNDLSAHENLGDALVKLGQRAEARAEWQYVLQRNPSEFITKEAHQNLAKYP